MARLRKRCRDSRDELIAALRSRPDAERLHFENADAGLHLVLAVETNVSDAYLANAAEELGVPAGTVAPLSRYAYDPANAQAPDGLKRLAIRYDTLTSEAVEALTKMNI